MLRRHAGKGVAMRATRLFALLGLWLLSFCLTTAAAPAAGRPSAVARAASPSDYSTSLTTHAIESPAPPWLTHPPGRT